MAVADPLAEVVATVLEIPAEQVDDRVSRGTVGGWTSLRHLQLVAAVEDTFGVSLTPREIRRISSVGDLREAVRARSVSE